MIYIPNHKSKQLYTFVRFSKTYKSNTIHLFCVNSMKLSFSFFSYFFFFSCKWIMLHQKTNNVIQILEIGRSSTIWSYNVRKFPKLLNYLEENKNFKALAKISLEKKMSNCCNKVQLATCKHLKQARTSMEQKNKTQGCDD